MPLFTAETTPQASRDVSQADRGQINLLREELGQTNRRELQASLAQPLVEATPTTFVSGKEQLYTGLRSQSTLPVEQQKIFEAALNEFCKQLGGTEAIKVKISPNGTIRYLVDCGPFAKDAPSDRAEALKQFKEGNGANIVKELEARLKAIGVSESLVKIQFRDVAGELRPEIEIGIYDRAETKDPFRARESLGESALKALPDWQLVARAIEVGSIGIDNVANIKYGLQIVLNRSKDPDLRKLAELYLYLDERDPNFNLRKSQPAEQLLKLPEKLKGVSYDELPAVRDFLETLRKDCEGIRNIDLVGDSRARMGEVTHGPFAKCILEATKKHVSAEIMERGEEMFLKIAQETENKINATPARERTAATFFNALKETLNEMKFKYGVESFKYLEQIATAQADCDTFTAIAMLTGERLGWPVSAVFVTSQNGLGELIGHAVPMIREPGGQKVYCELTGLLDGSRIIYRDRDELIATVSAAIGYPKEKIAYEELSLKDWVKAVQTALKEEARIANDTRR